MRRHLRVHAFIHSYPSIRCCTVSLLGWVFPFTRHVVFRLFLTLLASVPLSVWFEREYRSRRRLDSLEERLEALQPSIAVILTTLHVTPVTQTYIQSPLLNPAVPAAIDGVRDSFPIEASPGPDIRSPIPTTPSPSPRPLRRRPLSSILVASSHSRPPTPPPHSPARRRSTKFKSPRSPSLSSSPSSPTPAASSHSRPPTPHPDSPVRRRSIKSKSPRPSSVSSSLSSPIQITASQSHPPTPRTHSLVRRRSTKTKLARLPSPVVPPVPPQRISDLPLPPSPPVDIQRTRSSNFFSRIKFSFASRPPPPPGPSSLATATQFQVDPSPSTDVLTKPHSSNFLNRIKYTFAPRPLDREDTLSRTHSITTSISRTRSVTASVSGTHSTPPFSRAATTPSSPLPSLHHSEEPTSPESL